MKSVLFVNNASRAELEYLAYQPPGWLINKVVGAIAAGRYVKVASTTDHVSNGEIMSMLQNGVSSRYWAKADVCGYLWPQQVAEASRSMQTGDIIISEVGNMVEINISIPTGFKAFMVHKSLFQNANIIA